MIPTATVSEAWEQHHHVLVDVAYRMLGSLSAAEEAAAEAFVQLGRTDSETLDDLRAWLVVAVSRNCLDQLASDQVKREAYVGPWLPEPFIQGTDADPAGRITLDESVRMALMAMLERLTPAERVTYVLHEVLGYTYPEIAGIVDRSADACRQLATRARRRLRSELEVQPVSADQEQAVCREFQDACSNGDAGRLLRLLDPAVVLRSDGGERVRAARRPVVGRETVVKIARWAFRRFAGFRLAPAQINGGPGFIVYDGGGSAIAVVAALVSGRRIRELDVIANPDKLTSLVPDPGE